MTGCALRAPDLDVQDREPAVRREVGRDDRHEVVDQPKVDADARARTPRERCSGQTYVDRVADFLFGKDAPVSLVDQIFRPRRRNLLDVRELRSRRAGQADVSRAPRAGLASAEMRKKDARLVAAPRGGERVNHGLPSCR